MNTATESVCPKGWTLPSAKQINTIGPSGGSSTYTTGFNPVLGGGYVNSTLNGEATRGFWWGSETYGGANRYYLIYNSSVLSSNYNHRNIGLYIRCVSEEKTVTDLTYLQDMTGEIANNILHGASGKECWGTYNSTSQKGYGPAFQNACIHSGTITISGDLPTNWYNYTLASAGTIIDKNTTSTNPATNIDPATESICPKGWTLPNNTQIDSQRNIASFSPVPGGYYYDGTLASEATRGYWWGSEATNGALRYYLYYNSSSLYINSDARRRSGFYVRCVQAP